MPVPYTMIAFLVGAGCSMLAGYIGMMIATTCNVKTTYLCNIDRFDGFVVAFQGGQVLGFCLVGLALLILEIIILSYKAALSPEDKEVNRWTMGVFSGEQSQSSSGLEQEQDKKRNAEALR